ncbi:MAG: DNA polymerase III subunit delta' C-terminal domain-containing protein [Candidatus Omnitrophota bacterium]|nr:DNA polymerase III subunit delta' C-terminal domain-containing protein [Candidatus Omnitrophota bacterium]
MSFADLIGHEAAVRLLQGQIERDRLAHSYLFTGPEGIGKRLLAEEFARATGCEEHDLLVVTPDPEKGDILIEQIREMEGWMSLTPYGGKRKAVILDPAENLTEESTHACLKIVEEPPARSLFLLISAAEHRLPATLLSRCHKIRCSPQGIEQTAEALQKEGLDPAAARMLAISSGGRLGMALQFHRTGRLAKRNAALDQILEARKRKDLENPFPPKTSRDDIEEYVEWYASWCRDLLVLKLKGDPAWVVHQDRLEQLQRSAAAVPEEAILAQVDRAYRVREAVQKNALVKSAMAVLLSHG